MKTTIIIFIYNQTNIAFFIYIHIFIKLKVLRKTLTIELVYIQQNSVDFEFSCYPANMNPTIQTSIGEVTLIDTKQEHTQVNTINCCSGYQHFFYPIYIAPPYDCNCESTVEMRVEGWTEVTTNEIDTRT